MNHRIIESIITTLNADGSVQIAPMGVWEYHGKMVLAPFRPSKTLDNLVRSGTATVNFTDEVKVFAGCLTGHYDWQVLPNLKTEGVFLENALTHLELESVEVVDDDIRPEHHCRIVHRESHGDFKGFNRAQAAVIELAILVSRLHMLPAEKVDDEIAYLSIAIDKTAGEEERQAWSWLIEKVRIFRSSA